MRSKYLRSRSASAAASSVIDEHWSAGVPITVRSASGASVSPESASTPIASTLGKPSATQREKAQSRVGRDVNFEHVERTTDSRWLRRY
jgi:hypothetical protein